MQLNVSQLVQAVIAQTVSVELQRVLDLMLFVAERVMAMLSLIAAPNHYADLSPYHQ